MTPEQKELLIKDLCARLPYGVKGIDTRYGKPNEFHTITGVTYIPVFGYSINFDNGDNSYLEHNSFKPILFPLSAINQEIEVNGEKVKISRKINNNFAHRFFIDDDGDISIDEDDASYVYLQEYSFILDAFNKYHIDYRGLIDKGLAISVFDLPENPYK